MRRRAFSLRVGWMLYNSQSMENEGAEYARIAQNLLQKQQYNGILGGPESIFPPLYPLLIAATSFSGIAATSPRDATGTNLQGTGAAWTGSVTTTNPSDLIIGWSGIDSATTSTPNAPNIEIHDLSNSDYWESETSVYRIESTPGVKTVNGTWANTTNATANVTVVAAYKSG